MHDNKKQTDTSNKSANFAYLAPAVVSLQKSPVIKDRFQGESHRSDRYTQVRDDKVEDEKVVRVPLWKQREEINYIECNVAKNVLIYAANLSKNKITQK